MYIVLIYVLPSFLIQTDCNSCDKMKFSLHFKNQIILNYKLIFCLMLISAFLYPNLYSCTGKILYVYLLV